MKVERLDHVHIYVDNMEEVAGFFSDILGTKWIGPIEFPDHGIKTSFSPLGIEMLQSTAAPDDSGKPLGAHISRVVESRGNMIVSIGLKVPNLDEAVAELEARGIRMIPGGGNDSIKAASTDRRDTKGIMLELVEYEDYAPVALANLDIDRLMDIPTM